MGSKEKWLLVFSQLLVLPAKLAFFICWQSPSLCLHHHVAFSEGICVFMWHSLLCGYLSFRRSSLPIMTVFILGYSVPVWPHFNLHIDNICKDLIPKLTHIPFPSTSGYEFNVSFGGQGEIHNSTHDTGTVWGLDNAVSIHTVLTISKMLLFQIFPEWPPASMSAAKPTLTPAITPRPRLKEISGDWTHVSS